MVTTTHSRPRRRTALALALALCFAAGAQAQTNTAGAVTGRASSGDTLTISNPATGYSRTITVGADGSSSPETVGKYCKAILEAGGSRPAMESFKEFRGREPQLDALLRHQGMA